MASSSSLMSRNYTYNVFASFRGPDVRKTLLSHLREQFNRYGITMFNDEEIVRGATISPSLKEAIKESRISLVILSKTYASSGWCLDELVEILNCKEVMGQIVMTIFYDGAAPSHVRNQTGEFGIAFKKTCELKTEEERQKWRKALTDVANIEGEDFLTWKNEAKMIEKIARDISDKLNATPSRDFDGMVGLDVHLREMQSLLDLDYNGVKMVGITGPAGIGKTTIAKALHSLLSNRFQLTCFVDNLRGSYYSGIDELHLQEQFLSKILKHDGIRIYHSGVIEERLCKQKVLIILDDVNHIKQLEALANEIAWFGPGSRIIITTENKELLQQHAINNIYHVGFPSDEEALEILCRYAFRKSYLHDGFKVLAERIINLCDKLPLGLRVVGSSLRGKQEDEWEDVVSRLETVLDRDIEDILGVGYEILDENEQSLFLHIAVFFNYENGDLVKAMFDGYDLNVKLGLKILVDRSLITRGYLNDNIMMHKFLQQMARQAIRKQEPWKRKILMDAREICDVLENETGTGVVSGISFDISRIDEVSIGKKAFKRMPNLRFLSVYKSTDDGNDIMHISKEMEFPRRLRLLHWEAYPNKSIPPKFHPEYLVKLDMKYSKLEKLWDGIQPLTNLKKMNLTGSSHLMELPDLSNAINLERLELNHCESLVELPSSILNLQKLKYLWMRRCTKLEVIPTNWNLASLVSVNIGDSNISTFDISVTSVTEVSASSVTLCSGSEYLCLDLHKTGKLKTLTQLPTNIYLLDLSNSGIEWIPNSCIKGLRVLSEIRLFGCKKLKSLPELPCSLKILFADNCESLETVFCPMDVPDGQLSFMNCFKLRKEARQEIIQRYGGASCLEASCLPGSEMPAEFKHRAKGNTLTFPIPAFSSFKVCLVISPNQQTEIECGPDVIWRLIGEIYLHGPMSDAIFLNIPETTHLFIFHSNCFLKGTSWFKEDREIGFEFSIKHLNFDIIECGVQILMHETDRSNNEGSGDEDVGNNHRDKYESGEESDQEEEEAYEDDTKYSDRTYGELCDSKEDENLDGEKYTDCWSWLFLCHFFRNIEILVSGRRQ